MRVRIQQGSRSIEIEGEKAEVIDILTDWWAPSTEEEAEPESPRSEENSPKKSPRRAARKPARKPSEPAREAANKLDAEKLANEIKSDERFPVFNQRFIIGSPARSDRARFVSWFAGDRPLTSGDVHRVMRALGVNFDAPTASKAMNDAKSDFLKDSSGPQATFKLTAGARHRFEQQLAADAESKA